MKLGRIKREWDEWACGVSIEVLLDPRRSLVRTVLRYVKSVESEEAALKARTDAVIATLPFHLHD